MIRGLIFDFDGLMLDTERCFYQARRELYEAYGGTLPRDAYLATIGTYSDADPYEELERQIGRPLDRSELRAWENRRELELVAEETPLPGVLEYIEEAKRFGLKLAVASSSDAPWVMAHLLRLGIAESFTYVACGDEASHSKPHPDLYEIALAALGLHPEETIALEDSPNGIAAARAAGIFCVAIPSELTRHLPLDHADLVVTSLEAMPLAELLSRVQTRTR